MFSWGQNNSAGNPRISRSEHIASYVNHSTLKPSTRRRNRNDDSTYDTVFQTRSGSTLILRVHISASNRAPTMKLIGAQLTHPWIDSRYQIIGYNPISSDEAWEASGKKLGDAVCDVVLQLQVNPPHVVKITDYYLRQMQRNNISGANDQSGGPPSYESVLDPELEPEIDFAFDVPASFPAIDALSKDEINHLLNDDDDFKAYADMLPAKTAVLEFKSSITTGNLKMAKNTLENQETLDTLATEVDSLTSDLEEKMKKYQDLQNKKKELTQPLDVNEVKRKLVKAKKSAFDESEEIASDWVDDMSELSVKDFIDEFLEKRVVFHERGAKIEMLASK